MKATAVAPANIAFIKYWGKKDAHNRIPTNPSLSMNLSSCTTTTTVEFSKDFETDSVSDGFDNGRIVQHLDRLRNIAGVSLRAHVQTANSFPSSAGIASSASGFAALTVAAASALGLPMSEKELSVLARLGSGSACRSIPDGFVKWEGEFAYSVYPHDYWDLRDIVVLVSQKFKDTSSSKGHETAYTSPFFEQRLKRIPGRITRLEEALKTKNFRNFGEVIEEDCLDMHHVMQTQTPPLLYWTQDTQRVVDMIKKSGFDAYCTVDAGPNVHVLCEANDEKNLRDLLSDYRVIVNTPAKGAHIL